MLGMGVNWIPLGEIYGEIKKKDRMLKLCGSISYSVCVYVVYISIRGIECFPHFPPHPP